VSLAAERRCCLVCLFCLMDTSKLLRTCKYFTAPCCFEEETAVQTVLKAGSAEQQLASVP